MSHQFTTVLRELHEEKSLRAWSVIITFFGDSIAPRGSAVSASTVQNVMLALGVGEGTVRTALSRLAKDDWVIRQKVGRNSFYQLSDTGKDISSTAETIIYAGSGTPAKKKNNRWILAIKTPAQSADDSIYRHAHKLNKDCFLFAQASTQQQKMLRKTDAFLSPVNPDSIPLWVIDQIAAPALADKYHQLIRRVSTLSKNPPKDPLTSLAARTLLIHEWRRLLLKSNRQYHELLPSSWPHDNCLKAVARLYHLLSPAAEAWLDQKAFGPHGPLVPSDFDNRNRFRPV